MDAYRRDFIKLSVIAAVSLTVGGCRDSIDRELSDILSVSIYPPDLMVDSDSREITLKFNEPINPDTIDGNIYLSDKTGTLIDKHSVTIDPQEPLLDKVLIVLNEDFTLNESWKYTIVVTSEVESISGAYMPNGTSLVMTTTSRQPFGMSESEEIKRSKIVVISDLHMNEERGHKDGYSLFTQNGQLLEDFLEYVRKSDHIKELVILGDLLDMWAIPMEYDTFRESITDTKTYFQGVAAANTNKGVIDKINQIADEGIIIFSYVPGNHDMLLTEDIFHTIFPRGHWRGVNPGTGIYMPEPSVVLEHGHNYDLYNAPDSVTTEGSILPPGYFITRIYSTGNLKSTQKLPMETISTKDMSSELIYTTSWDIAVASINIPSFDPRKPQIVTGVDGYEQLYSSNGARDIYTDGIGSNWKDRQIINGVNIPNSVAVGIMNGSGKFLWFGTLEYSAIAQYFTQDPKINIVVFGHTHHAMLKQDWKTLDGIYANTGTWVDSKYLNSGALTGTYIILNTSESSGSDLDSVTLHQAFMGDDGEMSLKKIDEKNLDRSSV